MGQLAPATDVLLRAHAVAVGFGSLEALRQALTRLAVARADGDGPEWRTGICQDALAEFQAIVEAARALFAKAPTGAAADRPTVFDAVDLDPAAARAALFDAVDAYCRAVVEILDRRQRATLAAADPRPADEPPPEPKVSADLDNADDAALRALVEATWGQRRDLQ